jgi:hypothetical protein
MSDVKRKILDRIKDGPVKVSELKEFGTKAEVELALNELVVEDAIDRCRRGRRLADLEEYVRYRHHLISEFARLE